MKKTFLTVVLSCLLLVISVPLLVKATAPIVPCSGPDCTIDSFFTMLNNVYSFIVIDIAGPLAIIAVGVGGILMMISAGNPNLMSLGKKVFWSAIIGLFLVFGSYAIIKLVLSTIGYKGNF
jgi:type IV secretory pathway VirB2 component (pilin)